MSAFATVFGRTPGVTVDAPGRVNLIGEHTDYNGGFVLPIAIPQRTRVALAPSRGQMGRAWSREIGGAPEPFQAYPAVRRGTWIDYVQGVPHVLMTHGVVCGVFDVAIESDVPVGSGLSSSAALTVALLRGLRELYDLPIDELELARLARAVETDFVGAPVGVMDQIAVCFAEERRALFLDTRSLEWELVPLPARSTLIVIDSGVSHSHAAGEYRTRRAECERAAVLLAVPQLRDAASADDVAGLPPPLDRRARHIVTENARVLAAVEAPRRGDLDRAGTLFDASHASMRDDYEISVPEVDRLVGLLRAETGVYGARLTGGGFGGCVVALADRETAIGAARRACDEYVKGTGRAGRILLPL